MIELCIAKDHSLNLWKADMKVELPPITVTRYKADKSDFKYELRRAVSEIVEEIIEKAIEEE